MEIRFKEDGSLDIPEQYTKTLPKEADYIYILKLIQELEFPVGKNLLFQLLLGQTTNPTIKSKRLDELINFGILSGYDQKEIEEMFTKLLLHECIYLFKLPQLKYGNVIGITDKGLKELQIPHLYKQYSEYQDIKTIITEQDKVLFKQLDFFLNNYNDEQKKAITDQNNHILCIAGAGSGKTTTLVKRIEYLCKFKSIPQKKVLAITFTKKAKEEMIERLDTLLPSHQVKIETFNSFCEKYLLRHDHIIYEQKHRVITYSDKIRLIVRALNKQGLELEQVALMYATDKQKREKTREQITFSFVNDCFSLINYMKNEEIELYDFSQDVSLSISDKKIAHIIYICLQYIDKKMTELGLRDYTDQMIHTITAMSKHPDTIEEFEHILVDEYQDVNNLQIKLLNLLHPKNIFAVGDPRQSIFGWRGSKIGYILNFEKQYDDVTVINLTKNYRSAQKIVELMNQSIKTIGFLDLESHVQEEGFIKLLNFESQQHELDFITHALSNIETNEDTFVLARTSSQLKKLSEQLSRKNIPHNIRDEYSKESEYNEHVSITLSTVHSIKGLEADTVFVMGANEQFFPIKVSEHPIFSIFENVEYDKIEEEKRLFYVAISRAKRKLVISYYGKRMSQFINEEMLTTLGFKSPEKKLSDFSSTKSHSNPIANDTSDLFKKLKMWRFDCAKVYGVPAYQIITDKCLHDICAKMPQDLDDLQDIYGLGPSKIKKFGQDILDIIHKIK